MTPVQTVEVLLILVAMLAAVTFVIVYPTLAPVRAWTREGWHLWTFTLALVSLGGASISRRVFPEWVEHPVYRVGVLATYAALAALLWWRVVLLATAAGHDDD